MVLFLNIHLNRSGHTLKMQKLLLIHDWKNVKELPLTLSENLCRVKTSYQNFEARWNPCRLPCHEWCFNLIRCKMRCIYVCNKFERLIKKSAHKIDVRIPDLRIFRDKKFFRNIFCRDLSLRGVSKHKYVENTKLV